MPFQDTKEGQTHYENDGCSEPEHNKDVDFPKGCKRYNLCDRECNKCVEVMIDFDLIKHLKNREKVLSNFFLNMIDHLENYRPNTSKVDRYF